MIKTELDYNPYLIDTKIKFNGNEPRINSLVEKYTNSRLQSWIKDVPRIFHDEMNGYDFEFLFSGTDLEYEELVYAFSKINEKEEQVKLIHINKLESRDVKVKRINELLVWLDNNSNRKFDYGEFVENNKELITESYHYVVLHAELQSSPVLENLEIKVENIMEIYELQNTDLKNTPILICVNREVLLNLQKELKLLLSRDDVSKEQLFFYIDKNLSKTVVERTINDLGVVDPQIIKNIDDEIVLKYFDVYPITEYITQMINEFEKAQNDVNNELISESEIVAITNKDVHEKIDKLDISMGKLTEAISLFKERNELYLSDTYQFLVDDLKKKLYKWRSRKTKSYSYSEADEYALELSQNIVVWGNEFKEELKKHEDLLKKDIYDEYSNWYLNGEHQINYLTKVVLKKESHEESFNNELNNDLMKLKEERWVTPDKGILAQIFNPNEPEQEPVLQTTWQMNEWREQAEKFVYPILISMINNSEKRVMEYASELAEDYQVKLTEMLELEIKEKNDLIDLLSNEEKQLEIDYIWLSDFKSQLTKIEKE